MQLRADAIEILLEWDRRWTRRLNASVGVAPIRLLFRLVSRLGNGVFWYLLMFALGVTQGRAGLETSLRMLAAGAIGLAIYKLLKSGTTRARPYQVLRDIRIGIAPLDAFSFPSGHTLHAVAFTVVAVSNFPALAPGARAVHAADRHFARGSRPALPERCACGCRRRGVRCSSRPGAVAAGELRTGNAVRSARISPQSPGRRRCTWSPAHSARRCAAVHTAP